MADKKISQLTSATTPLAGTEVLPIVQSGSTVKATVANVQDAPVASGTANGVVFLNASKVPTSGSAFTFNGTEVSSTGSIRTSDELSALGGRLALYRAAGASYIDWASAQNLNWRTVTSVGGGGATTLMTLGSTGDLTVSTGNLVVGTAAKGIDFSANTHAAGMTSELLNWYEEGTWNLGLTTAGGAFSAITIADSNATYTRVGRQVTVRGFFYTSGSITGGSGQVKITGLPFSAASGAVGPTWTNPDTGNYNSPVAAPSIVTVGGTELSLWKSGATNNPAFVSTDLTSGGNSNYIAFALTYFV